MMPPLTLSESQTAALILLLDRIEQIENNPNPCVMDMVRMYVLEKALRDLLN